MDISESPLSLLTRPFPPYFNHTLQISIVSLELGKGPTKCGVLVSKIRPEIPLVLLFSMFVCIYFSRCRKGNTLGDHCLYAQFVLLCCTLEYKEYKIYVNFSTASKPLPISLALAFTKLPRHSPSRSVVCLEAEMK